MIRAAWLTTALAVMALAGCSPQPAPPADAAIEQPDQAPAPTVPQDVAPVATPAAPAAPATTTVPSTPVASPATGASQPRGAGDTIVAAPSLACRTDADCSVKDVGSCCGYRPACVNADAQTFPEQVKQQCADDGRMGICGFPAIQGCQCVSGQCAAIPAGPAEPAPLQ